ncbi:MAG: hypothetical protein ACYTG1_00595 [Planctomycetota bacterium]|jgi:hypothetical protein
MTTMTTPLLHALLENIVDYAGLFPPAKLDMATTVRAYRDAFEGPDAWMLGRLIVPAGRLDELEAAADGLLPSDERSDPWRLSVLTAPAGDEALRGDLERIGLFNETHATATRGLALADVIELQADEPAAIDATLDALPPNLFPFFELPLADDPRGRLAVLVGADAGAKARTGGVTADLYPTPAQLARFVAACAAADIAFKATAGLHHPLRHHSEAVGADEFGFLNVFIGAALALQFELPEAEVQAILEERSLSAFEIDADAVAWRGRRLTAEHVEDVRLAFAVSFGSCSFDEPRDDLRALGLLEPS